MNNHWERSIPFLKIDKEIADHLFRRLDSNLRIADISPLLEGCRNTNYLVTMQNSDITFLLRIFPPKDDSWKKEKKLLEILKAQIPVQRLLLMSQDEKIESRAYAIYEFVQGRTLESAIRSGYIPDEKLMVNIGQVLGSLHNYTYANIGFLDNNLEVKDMLPPLETWYGMFLGANARMRLGSNLVKKIEKIVSLNMESLRAIDQEVSLVHGDFRPANILINEGELACILDWEFAMAGHPLADIGQFFRRDEDFSEDLRSKFASTYEEVTATKLPINWYQLSKLRDLVNLLQMINAAGDSPNKFMDLEYYISKIVQDYFNHSE